MIRAMRLCFVLIGVATFSLHAGWTNYTSQSLYLRDWGITSVAFENDSTVWAATDGGGVVRYKNGQWEVFNRAASPLSGDNVFVICVCTDTTGAVWFGTNKGVAVYKDDSTWTQFDTTDGLPDNVVSAIARDSSGNKWFGTPAGLCKYDGAVFSEVYQSDTGESIPGISGFTAIVADDLGNIWASGGGGLLKYDGASCSIYDTLDGLPDTWVRGLLLDTAGKLWLLTGNGIAVFNGSSVIDTLNDPDPLASNIFLSACQDAAGYYWFGTFEHGLLRYDGANFVRYSVSNGLIHNTVQAIAINGGHLRWAGTPAGLSLFTNDNPVFTRALPDTTLRPGESLFVALSAGDTNLDPVSFVMDNGPAGAFIDNAADRFIWHLASDPGGGPRTVALSVQDPFGGVARDTFSVTINHAPFFVRALPDTTLRPGESLFVALSVADSNADSTFVVMDNGAAGAFIDGATSRFVWYLASDPGGGPRTIALSVQDPFGGVSRDTFLISINHNPAFARALPDTTLNLGESLFVALAAADSNSDSILFVMDNGPAGAFVDNATDRFVWHLASDPGTGPWPIALSARDPLGGVSRDTFLISINHAPAFAPSLLDTAIKIGESLFVALTAVDSDSDSTFFIIDSGPAGAFIDHARSRFVWYLASDPGVWPQRVALSVRDPLGGISRDTFLITKKTGTGTEDSPEAPQVFALSQVHPNPANPSASLGYCVPRVAGGRAHVSLGVYDLLGRHVAQVVDGPKPQGRYTAIWNGRDDHGRHLASGLYLIRMTAGNFQQQRLFTLLK